MSNTNKVYEIIMHGAVEGGYVSAQQTIGIFPTLDEAKAALSRGFEIDSDLLALDLWSDFAVYERTPGKIYENDRPVFDTTNVNVKFVNDKHNPDYEALIKTAKELHVPFYWVERAWREGLTIEEIIAEYDD